jgi:uncharacterized protein (DUF433 family)
MATVDEIRDQILKLNPEQAAQLTDWLILEAPLNREVALGIEVDPRVCVGEPRIARTRIPVWTLEQCRRLGMTASQILENYPTLKAENLQHAWDYVAEHRAEIEHQILDNESA